MILILCHLLLQAPGGVPGDPSCSTRPFQKQQGHLPRLASSLHPLIKGAVGDDEGFVWRCIAIDGDVQDPDEDLRAGLAELDLERIMSSFVS